MSGESILVVEDNGIIALEIGEMLEKHGYRLSGTTAYGEDAVQTAEKNPPDLICMDIELQGEIDGIETARMIHEHADIPVIYLSSYADKKHVSRAKETTPYNYIIKPFNEEDLLLSVDLALHRDAIDQQIKETIIERERAEKALLQANKQLNLLSSITRHDITNKLAVLQGYLTLLEKSRLDPPFDEYFQKAKTSANQIISMIQFTKEYESIGIKAPVWQDCRKLVVTAIKKSTFKNILVINNIPAGTEVFADALVEKVFYNLIENAFRYGGGKMTQIQFFTSGTDKGLIIVCEDNGNGISKEDKKHLFERGYGKNSGLGLFLSREILSISGISITETSEPGNGARFEIVVPKGMYRFTDASCLECE